MKAPIPIIAGLLVVGCGAPDSVDMQAACSARARAATLPAGFDVVQSGGGETTAAVIYNTGDGRGGSVQMKATCVFKSGTTEIELFNTAPVQNGEDGAAQAERDRLVNEAVQAVPARR